MAVRSGNNPTYRGHHHNHNQNHHQHQYATTTTTTTTSPLPSSPVASSNKSGHHERNGYYYSFLTSSMPQPPYEQDDNDDEYHGRYPRRRRRRRRIIIIEWFLRRVNILCWFSRRRRKQRLLYYCILLILVAASLLSIIIGPHLVEKLGRLRQQLLLSSLSSLFSSSSSSSSLKPRILILDDTLLQPQQQQRQELSFAVGLRSNHIVKKKKKYNKNGTATATTTTVDNENENENSNYYDIFDVPYNDNLPFSDSKYERYYQSLFDNSESESQSQTTKMCKFVAPTWQRQTIAPPTCNVLHEIGLRVYIHQSESPSSLIISDQYRILPLDSGGFKDVWYIINEEPRPRRRQGSTSPTDTTTTTMNTTNNNRGEEQSESQQPEIVDIINPNFVLKTTVYEHDHTLRELDKHRRDAIVMERATKSPYVLDMYAYCAFSNIVQAATGTLNEWRKARFAAAAADAPNPGRERGDNDDGIGNGKTREIRRKPSRSYSELVIAHSVELLKLATQLARGIADMHLFHPTSPEHYNKDGSLILLPTVAHADVKPSQFLLVRSAEGQYKFRINDFNRCRFLTWNSNRNSNTTTTAGNPSICPFYMNNVHKGSTMRSPEEYTFHGPQSDKIDVFSLGSIIYYLLTGHSPFDNMEYKRAMKLLANGTEPPLPKDIEDSNDRAIQLLIQVMRTCRRFSPQERPYSYQIVTMLEEGLHNLKKK